MASQLSNIILHFLQTSLIKQIYFIINSSQFEHIGWLARMSVLDTEVDGSNPGSSMLFP